MTNNSIPNNYYGNLLYQNYSDSLHSRVVELIKILKQLESVNSPIIPYLAAWNETDKIIWYEFAGKRMRAFLDCGQNEAAEKFRKSVVDRRIYCYSEDKKVKEEITLGSELEGQCQGLREEIKMTGSVDAIYKLNINDKFVWVKDQAHIEVFSHDKICLSLGFLTDVTKEMEQKALIEKIGYFDELTSLPRRVVMNRIFEINISLYMRKAVDDFVFMMIDIDYFKKVNDTFGHPAGDYILAGLAEIMILNKRKEDEIGRYGGEEFFCFSLGSIENCLIFAERLKKVVQEHIFIFEENRISITISIGLVAASQLFDEKNKKNFNNYHDYKSAAEKMIECADKALYKAKECGRNQIIVFQN